MIRVHPAFPLACALLVSPAGAEVSVKKTTDYKEIKKTAVLPVTDAEGLTDSGLLVAEMVRARLGDAGLPLLELSAQEEILAKEGIEVSVHTPKSALAVVAAKLGADAVVLGRLEASVERREEGTMSARRKILVRRGGRMVQVWKDPDMASGSVRYYHTEGPVDIWVTLKMVRAGTGEMLWFLSGESRKRTLHQGVREALENPLGEVTEVISRSLKGYSFKPKRRTKWKGLEKGWRDRHEKGRW